MINLAVVDKDKLEREIDKLINLIVEYKEKSGYRIDKVYYQSAYALVDNCRISCQVTLAATIVG